MLDEPGCEKPVTFCVAMSGTRNCVPWGSHSYATSFPGTALTESVSVPKNAPRGTITDSPAAGKSSRPPSAPLIVALAETPEPSDEPRSNTLRPLLLPSCDPTPGRNFDGCK